MEKNKKQFNVSASIPAVFNRDLYLNIKHADVKRLQRLLNLDPDTQLVKSGIGSPGHETDYYGPLTEKAVKKFQKKYGIVSSGTPQTTGYGRVGKQTRAKLAKVFKNWKVEPPQNNQSILSELRLKRPNPGNSVLTKKIRYGEIDYEFKFNDPLNTCLQCTEYVQYRVKRKLNIDIEWRVKRERNGGRWADIFRKHGPYKVIRNPKRHCAISFTSGFGTPKKNKIGHVAFVEKVLPNNEICISEVNWDLKGSYSKRPLLEDEWKRKHKGLFIDFLPNL